MTEPQLPQPVSFVDDPLPEQPAVTLFIPTLNEEAFVRETVGCVVAQEYPTERLHVLLIDGMSEDRTREIATEVFRQRPGLRWEIIDNPGRDVTSAWVLAQEHMTGDVFIYVAGHAAVAPDYVACICRALREIPCDGVSGPQLMAGHTAVGQAIAAAFSTPFGLGNAPHRFLEEGEPVEMYPPVPAFRTRLMRVSGGLSANTLGYSEDIDFWQRLRDAGAKMYVDPRIRLRFYGRQSYTRLFWQMLKYGVARGWTTRHSGRLRPDHLIPGAWALSLIASLLLAIWRPWIGFPLFAGFYGVHEIASLCAAIAICRKKGLSARFVPLTMLAFLLMHLTHGIFFAKGYFIGRDRQTERRAREMAKAAREPGQG